MDKFRLRCGITLIELTVALALSVLLMAATGGVIKSMMHKKKVFADRLDVQSWRIELAECLRNDLIQSKEMRVNGRTLELSGFGGHNSETGEPLQIPVNVIWRLKEQDGRHILLRIEKLRNGIEEFSAAPHIELAAVGVKSISVGVFAGLKYEEKEEAQTITAEEDDEKTASDWTTIPQVLKMIVHGENNEILVDELVFR